MFNNAVFVINNIAVPDPGEGEDDIEIMIGRITKPMDKAEALIQKKWGENTKNKKVLNYVQGLKSIIDKWEEDYDPSREDHREFNEFVENTMDPYVDKYLGD